MTAPASGGSSPSAPASGPQGGQASTPASSSPPNTPPSTTPPPTTPPSTPPPSTPPPNQSGPQTSGQQTGPQGKNPQGQPTGGSGGGPTAAAPTGDEAARTGGGLGEEARSALGAGQVTSRDNLASEARHIGVQNEGTINATNVAGRDVIDQTILNFIRMSDRAGRSPGKIKPAELDELRRGFVESDGIRSIAKVTDGIHAFLLRAPAGFGRRTAAIHLLQTRGVAEILVLHPNAGLDELAALEQNTGYVLCDPPALSGVTSHTVNDLAARLQPLGSYLIITVTAGVHLDDADLLRDTFELPDRPTAEEIVRSLLKAHLGDRAAGVLARPEVVALIGELDQKAPMRHAGELAAAIAAATAEDGTTDVHRVRTAFVARRDEEFRMWFDALPPERRSFAVAVAVLHRLPHVDVMRAARALHELESVGKGPVVVAGQGQQTVAITPGLDRPDHSRSELVRSVDAEVRPRDVRGDYGVSSVEAIEYSNGTYPQRVIHRRWHEFSQQEIVDWLRLLVVDRSEHVRIWAATAAGVLSTYSFDFVFPHVIERWAFSKNSLEREAAATALAVPADDSKNRRRVLDILKGWSENSDRPVGQSTAALAYGRAIATTDPHTAINQLHALAKVDRLWVAVGVGDAVSTIAARRPELTESLLARILLWLDDGDRTETGHLAFLILAAGVVTYVERPGQDTIEWPTLLYRAIDGPGVRTGLTRIWKFLARESTAYPDETSNVLRGWASQAEIHDEILHMFGLLARALASDDSWMRHYLLTECEHWVDPDESIQAPRTAARVRAILGER